MDNSSTMRNKNRLFLFLIAAIILLAAYYVPEKDSSCPMQEVTEAAHALELPRSDSKDIIIKYSGFTVSYDSERLIPKWVAYELTAGEADGELDRNGNFSMDLSYKGNQAHREDYRNSGWDKGHMAPAADMKWSEDAMHESFFLTNICPQNHGLNAGDWLRLEKKAREWARGHSKLFVVCGPVVTDGRFGTIGENRVCVPDGFFKAFLVASGGKYDAIGFLFDNIAEKHPLSHYSISVNDLEALTGMDLFYGLPDEVEEQVEDRVDKEFWGILSQRR